MRARSPRVPSGPSTLVGLTLGFALLTSLMLASLGFFVDESRSDAAQVAGHLQALEAWASAQARARLDAELRAAESKLRLVREDPLFSADGARLQFPNKDEVPGRPTDEAGRFADVQRTLGAPPPKDDAPLSERLRLTQAIARSDAAHVEPLVRAWLEHRARYVLPVEEDVLSTLRMLEALAQVARPSAELSRRLLRDGLPPPSTAEGAQRAVLRHLSRLARSDVSALCEQVASASKRAGVKATDFSARCDEALGRPALASPTEVAEDGALLVGLAGHAYLAKRQGEALLLVPVDLAALLNDVSREARDTGLLEKEDGLALAPSAGPRSVGDVRLLASVRRFEQAAVDRARALAVKVVLVVVSFGLALATVVLVLVGQQRRMQWVELKSDFVSTVSHELRTPLASLRLMAETLERKLRGQDGAKDYPARIVREVDGLSALVENILSFNRVDGAAVVLAKEPVPLSRLSVFAEEEAALAAPLPVSVTVAAPEGLTVEADAALLELVVRNLVRNGLRYGTRTPRTVRVEASEHDGGVALQVSDNGAGVPEADRATLFEAFRRGTSARQHAGRGSGLGLALSRRIVELHGGRLTLAQTSSEGTTFEVWLPSR